MSSRNSSRSGETQEKLGEQAREIQEQQHEINRSSNRWSTTGGAASARGAK